MKKISTLITAMLAVLLSFTFTSCDEDSDIAYTLEGTWKGNMYVSSTYNGRTYDTTYAILILTLRERVIGLIIIVIRVGEGTMWLIILNGRWITVLSLFISWKREPLFRFGIMD